MSSVTSLHRPKNKPLYSPEERARRDSSAWTTVQAVLAPLQFLVFLISLGLVMRYLATGEWFLAATVSVVVKTAVLYLIMVTGAIWEKVVFGRFLFAPAFFWEDVVSSLVMVAHTVYLLMLFGGFDPRQQMLMALVAYILYVFNAAQYVIKFRAARLEPVAAA